MDIAFGPVPSRRLGRSLGINNIPPKHCSYACVYCQVGPTPEQEITPRPFYLPEEILRQVRCEDIAALGRFIAATRIGRAYLAIPHRPPAVAGVRAPDEALVLRAFRTLTEQGIEVELLTAYEGDVFAFGGDLRAEILAISAVHPLRTSAVQALLQKGGGSMALVDELLAAGELHRLEHAGEVFYLRRLRREGCGSSPGTSASG